MAEVQAGRRKRQGPLAAPFEDQIAAITIIAGTPDHVVKKLRVIVEETRPSIVAFWAKEGRVSHHNSMTCIRRLGQEVMPAVREIGDKLGIKSPFEVDAPVSLASTPVHQLNPTSTSRT